MYFMKCSAIVHLMQLVALLNLNDDETIISLPLTMTMNKFMIASSP